MAADDARARHHFPFREGTLHPEHAGGAGHPRHQDSDSHQPILIVGRFYAGLPAFTLVELSLCRTPLPQKSRLDIGKESTLTPSRAKERSQLRRS
jgi:hypothetical protein